METWAEESSTRLASPSYTRAYSPHDWRARSACSSPTAGHHNGNKRLLPRHGPPQLLVFETWWQQENRQHQHMLVEYDTVKQACLLRQPNKTSTLIETNYKGQPIHLDDLHVGASVSALGRSIVLRKASLPTQEWLDDQARQLLKRRRELQTELSKFARIRKRHGAELSRQMYEQISAQAWMNSGNLGGKVNLRHLKQHILELQEQLVEHRTSEAVLGTATLASAESHAEQVPGHTWPAIGEAPRCASCPPLGKLLRTSPLTPQLERHDLLHWLQTVPLAASASKAEKSPYIALTGVKQRERPSRILPQIPQLGAGESAAVGL